MLFVWLYRSKFDLISCSSLGGYNIVVHSIPSEAKKNDRTRFEDTWLWSRIIVRNALECIGKNKFTRTRQGCVLSDCRISSPVGCRIEMFTKKTPLGRRDVRCLKKWNRVMWTGVCKDNTYYYVKRKHYCFFFKHFIWFVYTCFFLNQSITFINIIVCSLISRFQGLNCTISRKI